MDRSYMLNDYINENEENLTEKEKAEDYLENLKFRINGSKSITEIKKQVSIFLEKNNIPPKIQDDLIRICDTFDENTNLYYAEKYLEDYLSKYFEQQEKEYQKSNDTIIEIKEELIESSKKELDKVGITMIGNTENVLEKIQDENDVYKLKNNIDNATQYLYQRNNAIGDINVVPLEIPIEAMNTAIDNPDNDTILETVIEEQEKELSNNETTNSVDIKDDGSVEINGGSNIDESINFAAMMTTALVTSNNDLSIDTNLDMKFIKKQEDKSNFKIIYGNFPITNHPENKLDPTIINKIEELAKNYNHNVNYLELLKTNSVELSTALTIINSHVLNENGAFKMAIKNGGKNHEMAFSMDENYIDISTAFLESGAMVSQDTMENSIVRVNNSTEGEQLVILNATLENLNQRKLEQSQINVEKQYQKQLLYPNNLNQTASVSGSLLIIIAIAEIMLLTFGYLYLFS